jgi:chromosome segregation ATPase
MRKLSDMTPEERAAYTVWKSRLDSDMSTPEEQIEARRQMEALEWGGETGPVMARIGDIEDRLQSIEVLKGNRKFPVTKAEMEKAKSDIQSALTQTRDAIEESRNLAASIEGLKEVVEDARHGKNEILAEVGGVSQSLKSYSDKIVAFEKAIAKDRQKLERVEKAFKAENAKLVKALADVVSEAVEEAKTAIYAEAQSAAVAAVAELMGDKKGGDF